MRVVKLLALTIIITFYSLKCFGIATYSFSKVTVKDGLSSNTILGIAQDKEGRIWFATYNGLTVYDGESYRELKPALKTSNGRLPNDKPKRMLNDNAGNIWVLFETNQLVRIKGIDEAIIEYHPDFGRKNQILDLDLDLDSSRHLLVTDGQFYLRYSSVKDHFIRYQPHNYLNRDSRLKIIADHLHTFFPAAIVHSCFYSSDRTELWIATSNMGVFRVINSNYRQAVQYTEKIGKQSAIAGNEVYCGFESNDGTIWLGTKDKGISRGIRQNFSFKHFPVDNALFKQDPVRSIGSDWNHHLWLGTYSKGVYLQNGNKSAVLDFKKGNDDRWNWIRCIFRASDETMWVGSYSGLCRVNPDSYKKKYYSPDSLRLNSLAQNRIYAIQEDSCGNLYIGEWGALDYFNPHTGVFRRIDTLSTLKGKHIRKLLLTHENQLWVGTEKSGVFVIRTSDYRLVKHYKENKNNAECGLNSNSVYELTEAQNGDIWVGTFAGLNRIRTNDEIDQFKLINQQLPSTIIYKIYPDTIGNLWCGTIRGIVKIHVDDNFVRTYTTTDGVDVAEFSEGAGFRDSSGRIYLGGLGGTNFFNPQTVELSRILPVVVAENLKINNHPLSEFQVKGDSLKLCHLSAWQNDLDVRLHSIILNHPSQTILAWKLFPKDSDFQMSMGPIHQINYPNLHSGSYRLVVKSANADGLWTAPKTIMKFEIAKPFWKELYFILPLIILLVFVVLGVDQYRLRRIKHKNSRLEEEVNRRTHKIESQKLELEQINQQLAQRSEKIEMQKDQILAQRDHLLEMYDKLEESNRLKENFYVNISHDIRTPLTLIYGPVCELLKNSDLGENERRHLNTIRTNSAYIMQLLEQLLNQHKSGGTVIHNVFTIGNLVEICQSTINSFKNSALADKVNLEFYSNQSEFTLRFDYGKLNQITYNLLSNAMKFTDTGGKITCRLNVEEKGFSISIEDTGIGIPSNRIQYIFDRYYQVGKSGGQSKSGFGVGLSLVKEYVEFLGGKVEVESQEGKGSSFFVYFPFPKSESVNEELSLSDRVDFTVLKPTQTMENNIVGIHEKKTILLVEDNEALRTYLSSYLALHFSVIEFSDGKKALKYLKKNQIVDLVISDWIMPEMDGIEFCRAIRKKSRFQSLPFILITALSDIDNEKEGYFAGIDDFVSKPFDPEILFLKVSRLLALNRTLMVEAKANAIVEPENKKIESFEDKLLKKISSVIEDQLENSDFDQEKLANTVGLSSMQLYRKIKELTFRTPTELIRSMRMKRAKQLLEDQSILVNEVSDLVGFNDSKYFSRCFSRETGLSPTKYQRIFSKSEFVSD